jgi:hypothetical protein
VSFSEDVGRSRRGSGGADLDRRPKAHAPGAEREGRGDAGAETLEGGPVERVKELVVFQALDTAPLVATGDSGTQLASRLGVSRPAVSVLGKDPLATKDVEAGLTAPGCGLFFDDMNMLLEETHVLCARQMGKPGGRLERKRDRFWHSASLVAVAKEVFRPGREDGATADDGGEGGAPGEEPALSTKPTGLVRT